MTLSTVLAPVMEEEDIELPPTEDELPCSDGEPMETERHVIQMNLLLETLKLYWADRQDWYIGGNMFVYFSPEQSMRYDFKGPDVFVALGVERRERKSFVVWYEEKGPDVVIELISDTTANYDKNQKKDIYRDKLRVPEYYWFDPFSAEWAGFSLRGGLYEPMGTDNQDRFVSQALGLALVRWHGTYQNITARWLRWATLDGEILPTGEELALHATERAEVLAEEKVALEQQNADLVMLLARYRERYGELPQPGE